MSDGFKEFDKHDDSVDEHLDGLLKALTELEQKTGERSKADIVTWRGMMTKVMSLPFDMRNRCVGCALGGWVSADVQR